MPVSYAPALTAERVTDPPDADRGAKEAACNLWPNMAMLDVLMNHHDATGVHVCSS